MRKKFKIFQQKIVIFAAKKSQLVHCTGVFSYREKNRTKQEIYLASDHALAHNANKQANSSIFLNILNHKVCCKPNICFTLFYNYSVENVMS